MKSILDFGLKNKLCEKKYKQYSQKVVNSGGLYISTATLQQIRTQELYKENTTYIIEINFTNVQKNFFLTVIGQLIIVDVQSMLQIARKI